MLIVVDLFINIFCMGFYFIFLRGGRGGGGSEEKKDFSVGFIDLI